jgi:hypothetical protein
MRTLLTACALLLMLAAPADAALRQFQSPSKNIGCAISRSFARCDIDERDWRKPPRPRGCELDWGQGLVVGRRGRGQVVCAGDTTAGAGRVLRYGRSIHMGAMTCSSRRSGMRCRARSGHGFFLSRQAYRLF